MTPLEEISQAINQRLLENTTKKLAWTSMQHAALLPASCPIFKLSGDKALFGFTSPPTGVPFQVTSKGNLYEEAPPETVVPDPVDGNSCEIVEISDKHWDMLQAIAHGERVVGAEDISWLEGCGMLERTGGGNLKLTPTAKAWLAS